MSYQDERKRSCKWCAAGLPKSGKCHDRPLALSEIPGSLLNDGITECTENVLCTAPTEAEYIAELEQQVAELRKQNASMKNSMGDNLCWWMEVGPVQIPPAPEFLESCRRFHAQQAQTVGVLGPECMTIAQLEARVAELEANLQKARVDSWCDICCGSELPSGRECACGGTGLAQDVVRHLRIELLAETKRADAAEAERDNLRAKFCEENAICACCSDDGRCVMCRANAAEADTKRLDWL